MLEEKLSQPKNNHAICKSTKEYAMKIKLNNIEIKLLKRENQESMCMVWREPHKAPEQINPGDTVTLCPVNGIAEPFIIDNEIRVVVASNDNNTITGLLDLCDGVNAAVKVKFDKEYIWFCSRG